MPWTKASKIKFFQERRKATIKHLKELGMQPKDALKAGTKLASQQYQKYKAGFEQVNILTDQIDALISKEKKTKREGKKLDSLERKRQKVAQTTHDKWKKFQETIGYIEPSEKDIEIIRKAS